MKRRLLILLATSLFAVSSFAQILHAYEGNKNSYNYMVYLPDNNPDDKAELPLVVFLHGKSLSGTDLSRVRRYGPLSALQYGRRINALVLAPQSPGEAWKPKKVNDLIDWTIKNYPVDTTRIYVIGMSMGGYGTLDYVGTYPKRVAAAIAMCGGTTLTDFSKMKNVPLWIIHGTDDAAVPVENSDKVNLGILAAGGSERMTKYDRLDSVNHAMLARMFYLNETYDWLFKHSSKNKPRMLQETFDVRALLPTAYKGLKSSSGKIEQITIKDGQRPGSQKENPAPAVTPEANDSVKPTAKAETVVPQEKTAQEKSAQEMAAQEKAEAERLAQEKAAQEKAAKEKAERELAAKKKAEAAAKKKAEAEAAAKKKQQEELARKKAEEAKKKAEAARWYTVKNGDSQWSIAQKNKITVDQLRKWNKLTDKSVIHPGQKLRVKP